MKISRSSQRIAPRDGGSMFGGRAVAFAPFVAVAAGLVVAMSAGRPEAPIRRPGALEALRSVATEATAADRSPALIDQRTPIRVVVDGAPEWYVAPDGKDGLRVRLRRTAPHPGQVYVVAYRCIGSPGEESCDPIGVALWESTARGPKEHVAEMSLTIPRAALVRVRLVAFAGFGGAIGGRSLTVQP